MVRWRDAYFDYDGNTDRDDYLVTTIGYVVGEDSTWLHIAMEILPDGDGHRAITHVPRALIVERTALWEETEVP